MAVMRVVHLLYSAPSTPSCVKVVGIGADEAGGVVGTMQIHQQFVFGGLGEQAVVEVHHLLVVAVHEVDL